MSAQTEELTTYLKEWEAKIGAFIELRADDSPRPGTPESPAPDISAEAKSLIEGVPFAVSDNIAVKDFLFTCGSKHLETLRSPFDAAAVRKLIAAGAFVIGKTNIDEFGMGSSTENSALQKTRNPWDINRVPGGASGGSAAAVAAGMVPFALGSDADGSVRQPAALCGVLGLKPTYGAVSRMGLSAYASSMEGIGIFADSAARARAVFHVIRGKDPKDDSSRDAPPGAYEPHTAHAGTHAAAGKTADTRAGTLGVLSPETIRKLFPGKNSATSAAMEPEVLRGVELAKERFAALGYKLREVELPGLKYALPAFYTIAAAEAGSNMARFDGVCIGTRPDFAENPDELVDKARDIGFGSEVKLTILLGTYALRSGLQDEYYYRAQKIRTGIVAGLEELLGRPENAAARGNSPQNNSAPKVDALLLPVFPKRAFVRGSLSSFEQKTANVYNCLANLAGLPAVSFPASLEGGLPVGVQLVGRAFSEGRLLDMAETYEAAHPFPHPEGFKAFWRGAV